MVATVLGSPFITIYHVIYQQLRETLGGDDNVSMFTHIHTYTMPRAKLKWPAAIKRLTVYLTCGLMSVLVICKHRTEYARHRMSLNRPGVIKQLG